MEESKATVLLAGMTEMPFLIALMKKLFRNSDIIDFSELIYFSRHFNQRPCPDQAARKRSEMLAHTLWSMYFDDAIIVTVATVAEIRDGISEKGNWLEDPISIDELQVVLSDIASADSLYTLRLCITLQIPNRPLESVVFGEVLCLADLDVPKFVKRVTLSDLGDSGPNAPFLGYFREAIFGIEEDETNLADQTEEFIRRKMIEAGLGSLVVPAKTRTEKIIKGRNPYLV